MAFLLVNGSEMGNGRKGAFWEDRYHATAVESGEHLLRCIVYIDLNMVRVGVVGHPSKWAFSGFMEIEEPRRKCALIANDRLRELTTFETYDELRVTHKALGEALLADGGSVRESKWIWSIAVGSEAFVEGI